MVFSFSAVEILPKLLSKEKTQTIRPIPKDGKLKKKGSIHTLYWKQRNSPKGSWFCKKCGERCYGRELTPIKSSTDFCFECCVRRKIFPKILGQVEITEVFEIEISKTDIPEYEYGFIIQTYPTLEYISPLTLAKIDGFKSTEDMFKWFDKNYDLSTPKKFYVTRWKWL